MSFSDVCYARNGEPHRSGADVSFADLVKIFGFRSIHIGRWVTAAEQQVAANLFFDAFADLQQILNLPAFALSLSGKLALQFGTGGQRGVCAHYQPQGAILALAKNAGGGSLAHEWFHAFDHHIAQHLFLHRAPELTLASELFVDGKQLKTHPLNHLLAHAYRNTLTPECQAGRLWLRNCELRDEELMRRYYSRPEELVARAFEQVIAVQPIQNLFLVNGTLTQQAKALGVYPHGQHLQRLTESWLDYFRALGNRLTTSE